MALFFRNEEHKRFSRTVTDQITVVLLSFGDAALLMVTAWMLNFGSWSFAYYLEFLSCSVETELISFLVVLTTMTRRARIPFSSWLPAPMTSTTPVPSLVLLSVCG